MTTTEWRLTGEAPQILRRTIERYRDNLCGIWTFIDTVEGAHHQAEEILWCNNMLAALTDEDAADGEPFVVRLDAPTFHRIAEACHIAKMSEPRDPELVSQARRLKCEMSNFLDNQTDEE